MPYTTPSVTQFRERFAEFEDADEYTPALIGALLTEAEGGVGTDWVERDYQPAMLYLAAHLLETHSKQIARINASSGTSSSDSGLGMVKSISSGDRTVTFETKTTKQSGGANDTPDAADYESTFYGQQYLRLLRRNVVGIMTLNAS